MSNTFDLAATVLDMTREELLEAVVMHVDDTVSGEWFYKDEDAAFNSDPSGRVTLFSHLPDSKEPSRPDVAYLQLKDVEDEDGAPLPEVFVKVTFEIVDEPVPSE